jgi:hypothetical protein
VVSTVLPALRTMNSSPKPRPNRSSDTSGMRPFRAWAGGTGRLLIARATADKETSPFDGAQVTP